MSQNIDELLEQRRKLTELVKMAKLMGGKVSIGEEVITLAELKEMLNDVKIEIEVARTHNNLTQIKFSKN